MNHDVPRVVFDCMVFLQGLVKEQGPAVACLELFENGEIQLFVSEALLVEVRDVLTRPKLQRKFPRLTVERVESLFQQLLNKAELIVDVPSQFHYDRDPKDEPYVNLALAAEAKYVVSRDNDLLDLMRESSAEGKDFRMRFPHLTILDPVSFLNTLRPSPTE